MAVQAAECSRRVGDGAVVLECAARDEVEAAIPDARACIMSKCDDGGRLKLYGPSLTEVCTGPPGAIGCVGPCALCLGSVAHARSVVFCQPMTAFTCTAPEGCPKVTPWEQFPGLFRPSCMAWLTTEGLGRCGIVCYATLESFLIAKPSIPLQR